MKFEYLNNKKELFVFVLFVFSIILAGCVFVKAVDFFVSYARAEHLVKQAADRGNADPNNMDILLEESKKMADELKKKNLFAPPPPEQGNPVSSVSGIIGKEALINGKLYKVGDKIGDAEIVTIEPTQVKIKWNGSVKSFAPIAAIDSNQPRMTVKKKPEKDASKEEVSKKLVKQEVKTEVQAEQTDQKEDTLAWMGLELTDSQREKLELIFSRMPDEYKEQMKQQWNNMTDEQKQEGLEELDRMSMGDLERGMDEELSRR